jgi:signal transduction histidine kinase
MGRIILILFLLSTGFCSLAQNKFKKLVSAAYDSSMHGQYRAAINLLHTAAALKGKDTGYNESINLYYGNNYEALNKIDSSIYYYGEALKYYEGTKDYASMAFIYNHLGSAEINFTKRYDKAIDYFKRQINYSLLQKDSSNLFDCYNNIGIAYKIINQYDSALTYFNKVSANNSSYNTSRDRALLFTADTYSLLKQYERALNYYNKAIDILLSLNDSAYLFIGYLNKGDCLMKQDRFTESMSSLKQAQKYLNAAANDNDTKVLYHNLAYVYDNTGDYKNAFFYKNLEAVLKDSINTADIEQAAAEADAKFEVRRNHDSLLISRQNLALSKDLSSVRQRNFIIVLIIAIAISLLAFLAFWNLGIRKRANQKLELEKLKVETLAAELEEANQTKAKLFSIISHDLRSPISSLYALFKLKEIKASGESEENEQVTQLLDTMEDLLIWSKSQMNKFTLQPVMLLLHDVYQELIRLYHDVAEERHITIVDNTTTEVKIRTDENLLKTILRNIISNAINHALPHSTIMLNAGTTDKGIICSIINEADKTTFELLELKLLHASPDSGSNGLGLFLTTEFIQKLHATIDLTYANGHITLQIYIPFLPA